MNAKGWPLDIDHVEVVGPSSIRVRFHSGAIRRVNLAPLLSGPVFEPHHDPAFFAQVSIHPLMRVLVWPNDTDLAPEALLELPEEPDEDRPLDFGVEEARFVRSMLASRSATRPPRGAAPGTISQFYAIEVFMHFSERLPPHINARYRGASGFLSLSSREAISGNLPPAAVECLQKWMEQHGEELTANWGRVRDGESPCWIKPLV
ncbi:MAG: DUF4160 domain-containing protein [Candidatus Eisenbacteria bacterium]|nr:DUF4160 domain-containing protein [Candidatus Eisenbacteria bacterium]